jgi:DNA processing protein
MEPISILALQKIPNVGSKTIEKVLSLNPTFEPRGSSDLIKMLAETKRKFGRISVPDDHTAKIAWDNAHEIWRRSRQYNVQMISKEDPKYPNCLLHIPDPPLLLNVLGNIDAINKDCIAIIGTRKPTKYGITAARKLGALFAEEGYVVVSGLADGIDTAAHQGALDANGLTVAVLAHGLDTVYPNKNKELADTILRDDGALVSEYPFGTKMKRGYLIARDRIQSGLSLGVFVVETDVRGGTMHTVKFCIEQKRTLIVLKHPTAYGNDKLISERQADIVFETDDDMDLVKSKLTASKKNYRCPK